MRQAARASLLAAKVSHGRWKTCTVIAALRHDRVEAPWLLDGSVNGDCFLACADEGFTPTQKSHGIVIRDDLGSDKATAVRRAIGTADATLLFVTKYAPDLNPIEQQFARLKPWLPHAAQRSRDALCRATALILEHHLPSRVRQDVVNSCYDRT